MNYWGSGAWVLIFDKFSRYQNDRGKCMSCVEQQVAHLPCKKCSQHVTRLMLENNIYSGSVDRAFYFFIDLYNFYHEKNMYIPTNNYSVDTIGIINHIMQK